MRSLTRAALSSGAESSSAVLGVYQPAGFKVSLRGSDLGTDVSF